MRFTDAARFGDAAFTGAARFDGATFAGSAWFDGATFAGAARFDEVLFADSVLFDGTTFTSSALFNSATFAGASRFDGATFASTAGFGGATFRAAVALGPMVCGGHVDVSGVVFEAPTTIEVAGVSMECLRTRWESTATLRLRYVGLDLSDAVVTHPLSVTAHPAPFTVPRGTLSESSLTGRDPGVRLQSLRGADAAHLVLTDTDLSGCTFAGTFHLDQIRLRGRTRFARTPRGIRWRMGLPMRWTPRRTLAEEHHWRAVRTPPADPAHPTDRDWIPGPHHPDPTHTPGPDDLAPLYRDLRKAFEDGKNEPDAADFYYGEMDARRLDPERPTGERALLAAYWALSGYGLRASRAVGWLLGAMAATVLALMLWGLPTTEPVPHTTGIQAPHGQRIDLVTKAPDPELAGAFHQRLTSQRAEKATRVVLNSVVFRASGQNLTAVGTYTEMASRFLEPMLLTLALLATRGRVKR
ncbi:pentapeptide repeat-containing protein [Streptomyces sp. C11-1]|uniref:Pentapeptide repeat-containing protein n=1 Tax=Streptomyces durocortorensis TaxID=2811104 RepID=A0ABY9W2J1_9ACTN|nr:pentapeptide repeat-containing protein [Streptomyces durocortorensis]WNF30243.1 pentapeptide repeat-containing protein [Streptomyces durocortorensis]